MNLWRLLFINFISKFAQTEKMSKHCSTIERDADLYSAYIDVLRCPNRPYLYKDILEMTVKRPAKRFYISSSRAYQVVRATKKGEKVLLSEERQRMFDEIIERVDVQLQQGVCLRHAVENVIDQPAPEFYIKSSSAKILLHYERKRQREIFRKNPAKYIRG